MVNKFIRRPASLAIWRGRIEKKSVFRYNEQVKDDKYNLCYAHGMIRRKKL